MRRKDRKITDEKIIERILSKSTVCRIAMVDEGLPYIVPLNYGYFDNALYIHSAPEGRKIDILKHNNKVCFEIEYSSEVISSELSCDWSTKYRTLVGYGSIQIITDFEQKKFGLDKIMSHYGKSENNVYKDKNVGFMVILKLTIEQLSGKQAGDWE